MRRFILTPKDLFSVLIIIAIVVIAQALLLFTIEAWTTVAKGECAFKSLSKRGGYVQLNLTCDGRDAWTDDADTVIGYIQNPGPLTCTRYASDKVFCEERK